MRIAVNDHSGHSFTVQLSRQLSKTGYPVLHSYSTSFQSPKGDMEKKTSDPNDLTFVPIANKKPFAKYSLIRRRKQEIEYARLLIKKLDEFKPDVLIGGTAPLFVQQHLQKYCLKKGIRFYYWCQDIYSEAIKKIVQKRAGFMGYPIWFYFKNLEFKLLRRSTHIIIITDDFREIFKRWGIDENKITCIPNWAPVEEILLLPKVNEWSRKYEVDKKLCITYSGTLGLKHNPLMLSNAAIHFRSRPEIQFVVISEGIGADILKKEKATHKLDNLMLLPFQKFKDVSYVLASSDILLAILEKEAGDFSVPSKVLAYLCSQRPIVLGVPADNLSAKIVTSAHAGFCSEPGDIEGFCRNIQILIGNEMLRRELGKNGKVYAEKNFHIKDIGQKFIDILENRHG